MSALLSRIETPADLQKLGDDDLVQLDHLDEYVDLDKHEHIDEYEHHINDGPDSAPSDCLGRERRLPRNRAGVQTHRAAAPTTAMAFVIVARLSALDDLADC